MRKAKPDLRLDWRDPNMPVIRRYRMANGETRTLVDPDYERRYREMLMQTTSHVTWRNDPIYFHKRNPSRG